MPDQQEQGTTQGSVQERHDGEPAWPSLIIFFTIQVLLMILLIYYSVSFRQSRLFQVRQSVGKDPYKNVIMASQPVLTPPGKRRLSFPLKERRVSRIHLDQAFSSRVHPEVVRGSLNSGGFIFFSKKEKQKRANFYRHQCKGALLLTSNVRRHCNEGGNLFTHHQYMGEPIH